MSKIILLAIRTTQLPTSELIDIVSNLAGVEPEGVELLGTITPTVTTGLTNPGGLVETIVGLKFTPDTTR